MQGSSLSLLHIYVHHFTAPFSTSPIIYPSFGDHDNEKRFTYQDKDTCKMLLDGFTQHVVALVEHNNLACVGVNTTKSNQLLQHINEKVMEKGDTLIRSFGIFFVGLSMVFDRTLPGIWLMMSVASRVHPLINQLYPHGRHAEVKISCNLSKKKSHGSRERVRTMRFI